MSLVILIMWSSFSEDSSRCTQGFFYSQVDKMSHFLPSASSAQSLMHLGLVALVPTSQSTWNSWCVEVLVSPLPLEFLQVPLEDSFAGYKNHWLTSSFLEYFKYVTSFSVGWNVTVKKSHDNNFLYKYFFSFFSNVPFVLNPIDFIWIYLRDYHSRLLFSSSWCSHSIFNSKYMYIFLIWYKFS